MADVVRSHVGQERPEPVDHSEQVHADDPLEVAQRQLGNGQPTAPYTGVVAEQMDIPERLEGLSGERVHVGLETDVGRHSENLGPRLCDLDRGLFEHRALDVGEHDAHALGGETLGHRAADARGGPGDDRDLSLEVVHRQVRSRYAEWSLSGFSLSSRAVPLYRMRPPSRTYAAFASPRAT